MRSVIESIERCGNSLRYLSEQGVRSAQKIQAGPWIPVGIQLEKAEVGPTSGPTWRLSHLERLDPSQDGVHPHQRVRQAGPVARRIEADEDIAGVDAA